MKKRLISMLLAGAMVIAVAGCGSKEEAPAASETPKAEAKIEAEAETETDIAWPEKTITVICPFGAGGDTDYNARVYADRLGDILGETVVVTNVTGNGGATGAQQAHDSDPDGYTVFFGHGAIHTNHATGALDFGLEDGFELSCITGKNAGNVVCVSADSEYQTLDDLIQASNSKNVTFAANVNATTQIMGTMLNANGGNLNLVDMGGASDRVAALMGGQVDAIPNALGSTQQYLDSGDFRALALLESERNANYPDIPTAVEQGYDVAIPIYYYFAFPKGTDQAIVDKFADACEQISQMEEVQTGLFESYSQDPFFAKGEEAKKLKAESAASVEALAEMLE